MNGIGKKVPGHLKKLFPVGNHGEVFHVVGHVDGKGKMFGRRLMVHCLDQGREQVTQNKTVAANAEILVFQPGDIENALHKMIQALTTFGDMVCEFCLLRVQFSEIFLEQDF